MIERLVGLGLSNYEASAYLALLKKGSGSPVEVAQKARIPKQRVYDVLASLVAKGFCSVKSTAPKNYLPKDPTLAFERLLQLQEEEFRKVEQRKRMESQLLLQKLAPMFTNVISNESDRPGVEVLNEEEEGKARFRELLRIASKTVCITVKQSAATNGMFDPEQFETMLPKGIACRVLIESSALNDRSLVPLMNELHKSGGSVRTIKRLPVQLSIFDSAFSMLSVPHDEPEHAHFTSLVINHMPTVDFMRFAFDKLWAGGKTLNP